MVRQDSTWWEPCPPGELRRLAARLGRRRQRRRFLWSAGAVAATAATACALALWTEWDNPFEPFYAGITCAKVKSSADAYSKGQLSATVQDRIRRHLAHCGPCRAFYRSRGLIACGPHADSASV
jgi:hypothetical protein